MNDGSVLLRKERRAELDAARLSDVCLCEPDHGLVLVIKHLAGGSSGSSRLVAWLAVQNPSLVSSDHMVDTNKQC